MVYITITDSRIFAFWSRVILLVVLSMALVRGCDAPCPTPLLIATNDTGQIR